MIKNTGHADANKGRQTTLDTAALRKGLQVFLNSKPEHIERVRESAPFKRSAFKWVEGRYASISNVGILTEIYQRFYCNSVSSFASAYLASGETRTVFKNQTALNSHEQEDEAFDRNYGRTLHELGQIAADYCHRCGGTMTPDVAFFYVLIRLFFETNEGVQREVEALGWVRKILPSYCEIRPTDNETDVRYAVDAEVFVDGELQYAIQIKSENFAKHLASHREIDSTFMPRTFIQNMFYQKIHHVPVYYLIADKTGYPVDCFLMQ